MKYLKLWESYSDEDNTVTDKQQQLSISDLTLGDFLKKDGSSMEVKVVGLYNEWQSGYDVVELYNDVLDNKIKLTDISNYTKV